TVAFAVARVEERRRKMFARVEITSGIEIQIAVIVVVSRRGDYDKITVTVFDYSRGISHLDELAARRLLRINGYVFEDATTIGEATEVSVFVTVVVEVGENTDINARHVFRQTRFDSCIHKRAVATIVVKTWLRAIGEKDVVPAIVIVIDYRHSGWSILDDLECLWLPCGREEVWIK